MNPWIVVPVLVVLAVVYVMLPVGLAVRSWYRQMRMVRCPETGLEASVTVDPGQAGMAAALGSRARRVTKCALWPARQGCGRDCVRQPTMA